MNTRGVRQVGYSGPLTVTLNPPLPASTTTEPDRVTHIIIRHNNDFKDLLIRLENIFSRYSQWQDPLSQRILAWGTHVLFDLTTHTFSEDRLIAKLNEHIQILAL